MQNNVWFTADLHFGHESILYHRPGRRTVAGITLEELKADKKTAIAVYDKWLEGAWNDKVRRNDIVYVIGDFSMMNKHNTELLLGRLHGKKFLINGNHDKSCHGLERFFQWTGDIKEVVFNPQQWPFIRDNEPFTVELCHYPMLTWKNRPTGTCMVHGHTHGDTDPLNDNSMELRVDVGLDGKLAGYDLVSLEQLYAKFEEIRKKSGSETFRGHTEWLMERDGFRM